VVESWSSLILPIALVSILVLVYDYYIDAACTAHLDGTRTGQLGTIFIHASALVLSAVWNHPFVERMTSMLELTQLPSSEHQISGGVVVGAVMFAIGMSHICLEKGKGRALDIAPQVDIATTKALRYIARTKQRRTYLPYTFPAIAGTHLPTPRGWRVE